MKKTKAVLSYPFSGSIYAFLQKELAPWMLAQSNYQEYYRTLYGPKASEMADLSLTLFTMFEEVFLIPADISLPDYQRSDQDGTYYHEDLGLSVNYKEWMDLRGTISDQVRKDLEDPTIARLFRRFPRQAREHILKDIRFEMHLARQNDCPIIGSQGRKSIRGELRRIDACSNQAPKNSEDRTAKFLETYVDIVGLIYNPKSIDALHAVKAQKEVREYSRGFVDVMFRTPDGDVSQAEIKTLISASKAAAEKSAHIAGGFSASAHVLSLLGFEPTVGIFASGLSLASDHIGKWQNRSSLKQRWYELRPELSKRLALHEMFERLDKKMSS